MADKINPRKTAVEILCDIEEKNAYSNILLRSRLSAVSDIRDRRFITELVYGVIQYKRYLDYVIDAFSKIKTQKMSRQVLNILRLGVFQILKLDKVPQSAAVNESVNLAKIMANRASISFVNGVLRTVCREFDKIKWPKDPLNCLSVKESFPFWMAGLFYKQIGRECDELLPALNSPPKIVLRVNSLKTDREKLMAMLKKDAIEAKEGEIPNSILCSGFSVAESELYKKGLFSVQDTAAQLSVRVLNPEKGDDVLDMCAAPGGKTCYIAELMQDSGSITALDIYEHKKTLIENQAKRLGITIIKALLADAANFDDGKKYDKILVDAPCSGLGIIARKPEIKWNRKKEDMDTFSDMQYTILEHASELLKPGGEIVYSTCTLNKNENENVVNKFLQNNSDFSFCSIQSFLPIDWQEKDKGFITLWPHRHHTDGFFIAKLRKQKE